MKHCILIPCFNHSATVGTVVAAAREHGPVLVIDDGSTEPLPDLGLVPVLRLPVNRGKAAALRAGFERARQEGYTHAITMDSDGQHYAADLPQFIAMATAQPEALAVGVRDLVAAGAPVGRRRSNAVSSFWFRVETGVRLADTQCGFRCYPLALTQRVKAAAERYAFELEFMVRAAWLNIPLLPVPVRCTYSPEQMRHSHFRPVVDLVRITLMNIGLVLQSWTIPQGVRAAWSVGEHRPLRRVIGEFFAENAGQPGRLSLAVGLGLFCGIAPIWGYQMLVAATLAHLFRLNKAITLLASNISIPPVAPFILYGGLALGHWLFTGAALELSLDQIDRRRALEYLTEWLAGSFALGLLVAAVGTAVTYACARLARSHEG